MARAIQIWCQHNPHMTAFLSGKARRDGKRGRGGGGERGGGAALRGEEHPVRIPVSRLSSICRGTASCLPDDRTGSGWVYLQTPSAQA